MGIYIFVGFESKHSGQRRFGRIAKRFVFNEKQEQRDSCLKDAYGVRRQITD